MRRQFLAVVLMGATGACAADPGTTEPGGPVSIVVTRAGAPVAGAPVVFSGAGGELLATATTDDAGRASADAADEVTVVDPATPTQLTTLAQVRGRGVALEIPLAGAPSEPPGAGTLVIDAPPTPAPADTDHYVIETGCGVSNVAALPATVAISATCRGAAGVPVVVTAATVNASLEDPGRTLAYVAGLATATSASDARLTPGAWSTTCAQVAVRTEPSMSVQIWPRLGGSSFLRTSLGFCTPAAVPSGFTAYPVIDLGEGASAFSFGYVTGSLRATELLASYPSIPSTIDLDRARDLLVGDVDLVRMDGRGAGWSSDPALADTDVVVADLTWSLSTQSYVQWRFVLPATATSVERPDLPAAIETWSPLAGATERIAELRFVDASWTDSLPDIHEALPTVLDETRSPSQSTGTSVRSYVEQFYPDVP